MKKLKLFLLPVLMFTLVIPIAFVLTACGGGGIGGKDTDNDYNGNDNTNPVVYPVTYTVTFDTHGGNTVAIQTVDENSKATRPTDPTKSGYDFVNWFTAETGGTVFNFDTLINANTTIHAQWSAQGGTEIPTPSVTSVTVAPKNPATLTTVNATVQLTVAVVVEHGAAQTVNWVSSNNSVATVNASGLVTAVANGTVTITATSTVDGTKSDTATINVAIASTPPVEKRNVFVDVVGTGANGVTHFVSPTIPQTDTSVIVSLFDVPANATIEATNGVIADLTFLHTVTFTFSAGSSDLNFEITITAFVDANALQSITINGVSHLTHATGTNDLTFLTDLIYTATPYPAGASLSGYGWSMQQTGLSGVWFNEWESRLWFSGNPTSTRGFHTILIRFTNWENPTVYGELEVTLHVESSIIYWEPTADFDYTAGNDFVVFTWERNDDFSPLQRIQITNDNEDILFSGDIANGFSNPWIELTRTETHYVLTLSDLTQGEIGVLVERVPQFFWQVEFSTTMSLPLPKYPRTVFIVTEPAHIQTITASHGNEGGNHVLFQWQNADFVDWYQIVGITLERNSIIYTWTGERNHWKGWIFGGSDIELTSTSGNINVGYQMIEGDIIQLRINGQLNDKFTIQVKRGIGTTLSDAATSPTVELGMTYTEQKLGIPVNSASMTLNTLNWELSSSVWQSTGLIIRVTKDSFVWESAVLPRTTTSHSLVSAFASGGAGNYTIQIIARGGGIDWNIIYTDSDPFTISHTAIGRNLTLTSGGNGQVTGAGTYIFGQTVTVTATPNAGYGFDGWFNLAGVRVSGLATYSFVMQNADQELEARFIHSSQIRHAVTLSLSSQLTGVTMNYAVVGGASGSVQAGSSITLNLRPNDLIVISFSFPAGTLMWNYDVTVNGLPNNATYTVNGSLVLAGVVMQRF